MLLSHVYKSEENLRKTSLFLLEKVLIGFTIYVDVNMRSISDFNSDLVKQLSQKLPADDMVNLIIEILNLINN